MPRVFDEVASKDEATLNEIGLTRSDIDTVKAGGKINISGRSYVTKDEATLRAIGLSRSDFTESGAEDGGDDSPVTLTNDEKLSLPANTPVGTEVIVSDWEAAGLAGPHQRLKAPSTAQGGVFVSGGTQDGIFSIRALGAGSRTNYTLLGEADSGDGFSSIIYGARWSIYDAEGTELYYSISDVATPDLATNWKNASDDNPASITVTSVTIRDLEAGVTVAGAGVTPVESGGTGLVEVDGSYTNRGTYGERFFYNRVDKTTTTPTGDFGGAVAYCLFAPKEGSSWQSATNEDAAGYIADGKPAFPWQAAWFENDSNPPVPTVTRNDVASESNWEVVP